MDETNNEFAEFEAAFDDDYQITEEETGEEEGETTSTDTQEDGDGEDTGGEEEQTGDGAEAPEDEDGEDTKQQADPETFTLKVNKEERTVSRDEMIAFAQKGADYDRVKDQLAESRNNVQALQGRLSKYEDAIGVLEMVASTSGQTIDQITEQMHLNLLMRGGKSEAEAKAEMRAIKAETQLKAAQERDSTRKTEAEDTKARANREVAQFRERFPDVELTEELCQELAPDIQKGIPLAEAFQKRELARVNAELAEMKRKQAADQQNKRNRNSSIGSQRDSGGRREKSDFDDFMSAFE